MRFAIPITLTAALFTAASSFAQGSGGSKREEGPVVGGPPGGT